MDKRAVAASRDATKIGATDPPGIADTDSARISSAHFSATMMPVYPYHVVRRPCSRHGTSRGGGERAVEG
jgi:hypothetical protein